MEQVQVDVDDSAPVLLFGTSVGSGETRLLVRNVGPDDIFLGDDTVTPADGVPLKMDEVFNLSPARRQDSLYAICDTAGAADVRVLFG